MVLLAMPAKKAGIWLLHKLWPGAVAYHEVQRRLREPEPVGVPVLRAWHVLAVVAVWWMMGRRRAK